MPNNDDDDVFTCVVWQVTLCDLIWEVTLHSCVMGYVPLTAVQYLYLHWEPANKIYKPSDLGKISPASQLPDFLSRPTRAA